ncbi:MAG: PKD domain-containing protein [Saprospiraceae bacterium]
MNQILPGFTTYKKQGGFFLLLCLLFAFQQGNAQHCIPGFHFTVDGYTVIFDNLSTADGPITGYDWDFGDGQNSAEENPTHTYATSGTFDVCLTITAQNPACTATFCHHVVVNAPPAGVCHASFEALQPDLAVLIIDFTDLSTSEGTIGSWAWDFGDDNTSTEQNPTHTYDEPGTYLVCLIITDDDGVCTDHVCQSVVVHHPPAGICHASFIEHPSDTDPLTIDFTDLSTSEGTINTWAWDFGDGTTSNEQNPTHTYTDPGTYLVCLTITDIEGECTSHVCHEVVVHHPPAGNCHAIFVAHQSNPDSLSIDFTDQSTSDGTIGSWAWDFGDGTSSTEQSPSHTYAEPGTYVVCLVITDDDEGCTSHVCHEVIVHHAPPRTCHAAFTVHQPDPNILTFDFTDVSTSHGTIGTWAWDFGDGTTSDEQNPSHTFVAVGTYLVCLTITDDDGQCTDHVCHHVVVHHPPADEDNVEQIGSTEQSGSNFQSIPSSPQHALIAKPIPLIKTEFGERTVDELDYIVNYPNPFASSTTLQYTLAKDADVKIELYDALGKRLIQIDHAKESAGNHSQLLHADDLGAGFYIVRMIVGGESFSKMITVIK